MLHCRSHRSVRASEVVSPPDIFSPNSVSLQFYNGKKTDYSIGIGEITILNELAAPHSITY